MPNWCSTQITITHDNEEILGGFYELLKQWTNQNAMENAWGTSWLGNVVLNSKIGTVDENKPSDLRCRGEIACMEYYGKELIIDTETAWTPMLRMWVKLINTYIPNAELIYHAEETGCDLFYTNDPSLVGKYYVDNWDDGDTEYEADEDFVISTIQNKLGIKETDIDVLIDMFENSEEGENFSIHKWKWADASEWD